MPTTPLGIPYPALTDTPDGASQMQAMAAALDRLLTPAAAQIAHSYAVNTGGISIPDSTYIVVTGWTAVEAVGMPAIVFGYRSVSVPGVYSILGQLTFGAVNPAVGVCGVRLLVNATVVHEFTSIPSSVSNTPLPFFHTASLVVGDQVSVQAYQNHGTPRSLTTAAGTCHWSMALTGPT